MSQAMNILSVSQAIAYLRELLETDIVLGDIWISGEVSGPRTQPSGHTYFTLKDPEAQLRGVMFRSAHISQHAHWAAVAAPNHLQFDHPLVANVNDVDIASMGVDVGPDLVKREVHAFV